MFLENIFNLFCRSAYFTLKEAQSTIWRRANRLDFQRSSQEQSANPHATMAGVPDKYNSLRTADQKFSIGKGPGENPDEINLENHDYSRETNSEEDPIEALLRALQLLVKDNKQLQKQLKAHKETSQLCQRCEMRVQDLSGNARRQNSREDFGWCGQKSYNPKAKERYNKTFPYSTEYFRSNATGNNQIIKSDSNLFNAKQNPGSFKGTKLKRVAPQHQVCDHRPESSGEKSKLNLGNSTQIPPEKWKQSGKFQKNLKLRSCKYCKGVHRWGSANCPAYGKFCRNCFKKNHTSTACWSKIKITRSIIAKSESSQTTTAKSYRNVNMRKSRSQPEETNSQCKQIQHTQIEKNESESEKKYDKIDKSGEIEPADQVQINTSAQQGNLTELTKSYASIARNDKFETTSVRDENQDKDRITTENIDESQNPSLKKVNKEIQIEDSHENFKDVKPICPKCFTQLYDKDSGECVKCRDDFEAEMVEAYIICEEDDLEWMEKAAGISIMKKYISTLERRGYNWGKPIVAEYHESRYSEELKKIPTCGKPAITKKTKKYQKRKRVFMKRSM